MADQYGFSLGNAYSQAEEIKRARMLNAFAEREQPMREEGMRTENAINALRLKEARRLSGDEDTIRAAQGEMAAEAGLEGAELALTTIDPALAKKFTEHLATLDDKGIERVKAEVERMGKAAAYVKSAANPEEAYNRVKMLIPEEQRKQMPEVYDEQYVTQSLAQASEMQQLIDQFEAGGTDGNAANEALLKDAPASYMWTDAGRTKLRPIPGGPKDPASGGGGAVEPAVSNAIRATVLGAFGGIYDPLTGEIGGLDPEQANTAIAIMADAEMLAAKEGLSVAQAVQRAMKNAGKDAPAATPTENGNAAASAAGSDPAGLGL